MSIVLRNRIFAALCIAIVTFVSAETYAAVAPLKAPATTKALKPYLAQRAFTDMQLRQLSKLANSKKIDSETLFARLQKLRSQ